MNNINVIQFILDCLKNSVKVVLAVVVTVEGSTPGKPGFKMAVAENGTMKGSVGGGVTEFELAEDIKKYFRGEGQLKSVQSYMLDKSPDATDDTPICGGTQAVVLYQCRQADIEIFERIIALNNRNISGVLKLSQDGITVISGDYREPNIIFEMISDIDWRYLEHFCIENIVYIIGGGHVGLALSRILATLDFYIVVIDDRRDINTITGNTFAHQIICHSYDRIDDVVPDADNSYIIIMTAGHKADELVLEKLIHKKAKYLGMMGSTKKVPHVFSNLRRKGISDDLIKKVHAPIGVQISSHTPAEIAISIAAELIQIKNSNG
ncbi:XdhC family protein [candidate division KSB1 bacterium]|nr:XdhC family protein [candidate division KSB1 bacterium]